MNTMSVGALFLLMQITGSLGCGEPFKRVCYYTSWTGVMPNRPDLCTHIVYSFAGMENGLLSFTSEIWTNSLKDLKRENPSLKIILFVHDLCLIGTRTQILNINNLHQKSRWRLGFRCDKDDRAFAGRKKYQKVFNRCSACLAKI
jgi:hypothetical protein